MSLALEISTTNYSDDRLAIKMALSHMETLVGCPNGYVLSEPYSKFGWTFFKIALKADLLDGIEKKFADMIEKYQWSSTPEKFTKFMTDYLVTKGCNVRIKSAS